MEKVYSLKKEIPTELREALAKTIDKRDHAADMIKEYTDDWVKAQKKFIELQDVCKKLSEGE